MFKIIQILPFVFLFNGLTLAADFDYYEIADKLFSERNESDFHPTLGGGIVPQSSNILPMLTQGATYSPGTFEQSYIRMSKQFPGETLDAFRKREFYSLSLEYLESKFINDFRENVEIKNLLAIDENALYSRYSAVINLLSSPTGPFNPNLSTVQNNALQNEKKEIENKLLFRQVTKDVNNFIGGRHFQLVSKWFYIVNELEALIKQEKIKLEQTFTQIESTLSLYKTELKKLNDNKTAVRGALADYQRFNLNRGGFIEPPYEPELDADKNIERACRALLSAYCPALMIQLERFPPLYLSQLSHAGNLLPIAQKATSLDLIVKAQINAFYQIATFRSNALFHLLSALYVAEFSKSYNSAALNLSGSYNQETQFIYWKKIKQKFSELSTSGSVVPAALGLITNQMLSRINTTETLKSLIRRKTIDSNETFERVDNPVNINVRRFDKKYWFRLHRAYPGNLEERALLYNVPMRTVLSEAPEFYIDRIRNDFNLGFTEYLNNQETIQQAKNSTCNMNTCIGNSSIINNGKCSLNVEVQDKIPGQKSCFMDYEDKTREVSEEVKKEYPFHVCAAQPMQLQLPEDENSFGHRTYSISDQNNFVSQQTECKGERGEFENNIFKTIYGVCEQSGKSLPWPKFNNNDATTCSAGWRANVCCKFERFCGPDRTERFIAALNIIYLRVKSLNVSSLKSAIVFMAENGNRMDFFDNLKKTKLGKCPTNCKESITLLEHCVHEKALNNILYGYVGARMGLDLTTLDTGGHLHENFRDGLLWYRVFLLERLKWDPPAAQAAYAVGHRLGESGVYPITEESLRDAFELTEYRSSWWSGTKGVIDLIVTQDMRNCTPCTQKSGPVDKDFSTADWTYDGKKHPYRGGSNSDADPCAGGSC